MSNKFRLRQGKTRNIKGFFFSMRDCRQKKDKDKKSVTGFLWETWVHSKNTINSCLGFMAYLKLHIN